MGNWWPLWKLGIVRLGDWRLLLDVLMGNLGILGMLSSSIRIGWSTVPGKLMRPIVATRTSCT